MTTPATDRLFEKPCDICGDRACRDPRNQPPTTVCFETGEAEFGALYFCATHWKTPWGMSEREIVRQRRKALATPPETYQSQPDPLPEVLPAGTHFFSGGDGFGLAFTEPATLNSDHATYSGRYRSLTSGKQFDRGMTNADNIDWSRVPIRPRPERKGEGQSAYGAPKWRCRECGEHREATTIATEDASGFTCGDCAARPTQPAPPDANVWGIKASVETKHAPTTCNEPGCNCPYCRHRAFSLKLGANDPRYNGGKGPAYSALDRSISAARQSNEREAGVKRWDAWVSTRHARNP